MMFLGMITIGGMNMAISNANEKQKKKKEVPCFLCPRCAYIDNDNDNDNDNTQDGEGEGEGEVEAEQGIRNKE